VVGKAKNGHKSVHDIASSSVPIHNALAFTSS
jgi:hypothetical protein